MKNIVITGDSLSYNRYGYDDEPRTNAYDCHIGMDSWSFRIRKEFISSAPGFLYANAISFDGEFVCGMGEGIDDINGLFGEKVVTIKPQNGKINFEAESDTGEIVIYFQKRPDNYCRFNIYADGVLAKEAVDTYGGNEQFQGYGLKPVKIPCSKEKRKHKIILSDFETTEKEPYVTIAGISPELREVYTTGQGSRTAKFLLYHFNERIAKYSPDTLILIFGGNDILFYSEEEYKKHLSGIFQRMAEEFPLCRIITLTIPESAKIKDEIRGMKISTDEDYNFLIDKYNRVLEELSEKNNALCIKQKEVFKGISPDVWRYDNVHLSNAGNDILYEKIREIL